MVQLDIYLMRLKPLQCGCDGWEPCMVQTSDLVYTVHTLLETFWRISLHVTDDAIAKLCVTYIKFSQIGETVENLVK